MRALTLWQHKIKQAVIAHAQARLNVLATAWSGSLAVRQQWLHQLLLRRSSNGQGIQFAQLPSWML